MSTSEHEKPFVFLFAGPSGHGKMTMAAQIGALLGVNTCTIKGIDDPGETISSFLSAQQRAQRKCRGVIVVEHVDLFRDGYIRTIRKFVEYSKSKSMYGHGFASLT